MKTEPIYDIDKYFRSVGEIQDNCPSANDLINELQNIGEDLKKFNDKMFKFDNEVFKILSDIDNLEDEFNENIFDNEDLNDRKKEEIMDFDDEKKIDFDDFEKQEQFEYENDNLDEELDENDTKQLELYSQLNGVMQKIEDQVSFIDRIIDAELVGKQLLDLESENLNSLLNLQNNSRLETIQNLNKEYHELVILGSEISSTIHDIGYDLHEEGLVDKLNDVNTLSQDYLKKHFWTAVAKSIQKKAKKIESNLISCIRKKEKRYKEGHSLLQKVINQSEICRQQLDRMNEINAKGNSIESNLLNYKTNVEKELKVKLPNFTNGCWNGKEWNLSINDSKELMHPLVAKRMKEIRECNIISNNVEKVHPQLEDLTIENYNNTHIYPSSVVVGKMYYTHSRPGIEIETPIMVDIPSPRPLMVPESSNIASILLRFAWTMPQGCLEIIALDHETSGQNILPINDLSDIPNLLRVVTETNGLQNTLDELDKYMGKISSQNFKNRITDWASYNAKHPRHPLPCKIIAICSLHGFDSWSDLSKKLVKIMQNGYRHGVFVIISETALSSADDKTKKIIQEVTMRYINKPVTLNNNLKRLKFVYEPAEIPEDASSKMNELKAAIEEGKKKSVKTFLNLFDKIPLWKGSSSEGLKAPIGWDSNGRPVYFKLDTGGEGGTAVHALVGGQTGSGKSVLLHTLIQSLAYVYSPDELQFYLFDFKNGVEFHKYSNGKGSIWMPHIHVVSVQNDPHYALELFKHLVEVEFPARNEKFKKFGSEKIGDFVKKGGKMPRLVVIVDEFQELFGDHDGENIGDELTNGLKAIVKQGRSVGVHLIIATQTMASAHATMKGSASDILQQIGLRLALWGTGNEEILADNNKDAAKITPRKQCIINAMAGLKGGNVVFDFPFSSPNSPDGEEYRKKLEEVSRRGNYKLTGKMFDGSKFPHPPSAQEVKRTINEIQNEAFLGLNLGVYPDFAASSFSVPFDNLAGEHLLIGAEDVGKLSGGLLPTDAWSGICSSVINSLKVTEDCALFYYNAGSTILPNNLPSSCLHANIRTTEQELLELFKKFISMSEKRKVLVVENYHKASLLHPGNKQNVLFGNPQVENKEETAKSIFLSAFIDAGIVPFSVVLLTKNVKTTCEKILGRIGSEANILEACSKRIAFNVTGEILKKMIPDSTYSQQRGPRRIWYEDVKTGLVTSFVPYAKD